MALKKCGELPENKIYLIPLRLDDCEIPNLRQHDYGINLRNYQWIDLFEDNGFEQLVKSIEFHFPETAYYDFGKVCINDALHPHFNVIKSFVVPDIASGFPHKYWVIEMEHTCASHRCSINVNGATGSLASCLSPEPAEDNQSDLSSIQKILRFALKLNSLLSTCYVGAEEGLLIFRYSFFTEDLSTAQFYRMLVAFNQEHEYGYRELIRKAHELGVRFRFD